MVRTPVTDIRRAVRLALQEDLPLGDATTVALFPAPTPARARIVAQQPLVVAGLAAALHTFRTVDASLVLSIQHHDGEQAQEGACLLQIEGDGRSILKAERVALNFLQHLSGVATLTRRFCEAVRKYPVTILDTRKTIRAGGCHRAYILQRDSSRHFNHGLPFDQLDSVTDGRRAHVIQ